MSAKLCPYGCGFTGVFKEVKQHTKCCPGFLKKPKCLLKYCAWKGDTVAMEDHFLECHQPSTFFKIKRRDDQPFTINFEDYELYLYAFRTIYFLLESEERDSNFWLRLYKKNKKSCVILFHIAHIRQENTTVRKMFNCSITTPSNTKQEATKVYVDNWTHNIRCNAFIGEKIFKINIKESGNKLSLYAFTNLGYLTCRSCNINCIPPLYACDEGHVTCLNCFNEDKICQTSSGSEEVCGRDITNIISILIEQGTQALIGKIKCCNKSCDFMGTSEQLQIHKTRCTFTTSICVIEDCSFKATDSEMEKHWKEEHADRMFINNTIIDNNFKQTICITANKFFYLKHIRHDGKAYLYVFELTDLGETPFKYDMVCAETKHINDKCTVKSGKVEAYTSTKLKMKDDYDYEYDRSKEIKTYKLCRLTFTIF